MSRNPWITMIGMAPLKNPVACRMEPRQYMDPTIWFVGANDFREATASIQRTGGAGDVE
jgi:hypothetical protein